MSASQGAYSGLENLEVMKEARNYNKYLLSQITKRTEPGKRILDFGAGAGTFAAPLKDLGFNVVCIEPDLALRTHLHEIGLSAYSSVNDVADGSIDLIYTLNVLEHIQDDRAAAQALIKKLRCGGGLLVYVPAFAILYSSMDRKVGHFRRYRRAQLMATISAKNIAINDAQYVDSLGFWAALVYRLLDDSSGKINRRAIKVFDRFIFPLNRLLDPVFGRLFGKNLIVYATKKGD